jgi:hypothetical protein
LGVCRQVGSREFEHREQVIGMLPADSRHLAAGHRMTDEHRFHDLRFLNGAIDIVSQSLILVNPTPAGRRASLDRAR